MKKLLTPLFTKKDYHNTKHPKSKWQEGWTFVETLISIAIVLLLTGTVSFMSFQFVKQAKVVAAKSQISSFVLALQSYQIDNGGFPTEEQGLQSLWERPILDPLPTNWNGPYIDQELPVDPWGTPFVYKAPGDKGFPFTIVSYGSDKKQDGEDSASDIVSWKLH